MRRIKLPGDEWAEIRDKDDLTNRQRKDLRRTLQLAMHGLNKLTELGYDPTDIETWGKASDLSPDEVDPLSAYQSQLALTCLIRWSLDQDVPKTEEALDELPGPLYDAIVEGCTDAGKQTDFDVDGAPDPKADTDSSQSPAPSSAETSSPQESSSSQT